MEADSFPYDYGAGVCPFAEGVAFGSCLPDSIMVGRTAPIGSGFVVVRELGRRGVLVGAARGSVVIGVTVALEMPAVFGAAGGSEPDSLGLLDSGRDRLSRLSAASAPASRICSMVGPVDFLVRDLGLVVSGVGDSEEVCSEGSEGGGASSLGASGFFSRATITSCAWTRPTRTRPQNNTLNNPLSIKLDKQIRHAGKLANKPLLASWPRDLNHRHRKAKAQLIFQKNLHMVQSVLLKLHATKVVDVCCVPLHFF